MPGEYSLSNIENLDDIIEKAGGLTDYAIKIEPISLERLMVLKMK